MPPQPTDGPLKRAPRAITKPYIRKPKVAKVPYKSSAQPKLPVHKHIHFVEYVTREVRDNNDDDDKSEDDEVEDTEKQITKLSDTLDLCACMEQLRLEYSAPNIPVLSLQTQLRKLRGHFHQLDNQSQVQVPLDHFWTVTLDVDMG